MIVELEETCMCPLELLNSSVEFEGLGWKLGSSRDQKKGGDERLILEHTSGKMMLLSIDNWFGRCW